IVLADPGTTKRERTTLAADLAGLVARPEDPLARRDLEEARGVAGQAAGVHPHDPAVHLLLGRIALASGRSVDAVEELRRALRLDPLAVAAYRVLGYALVGTGRFGEAVEQWDQWERLAARLETELAQLEEVRRVAPDDPGVAQELAMARGGGPADAQAVAGGGATEALTAPEPIAPAAQPLEEARVFAGLEGAQEGLLLLDASGRVLGGALKDSGGRDVTDAVAAYLAGVSQEAARTVKLLGLGKWTGLAAE